MTTRRDRAVAIAATVAVVVVLVLIVSAVVQGQNNGRDALEKQQLAQIDQLSASMNARIAVTLESLGGSIGTRPWKLTPNDPGDRALLEQFNGANRAGAFIVDRAGTITTGVLLDGASVGTKYDNRDLASVFEGKTALLSTRAGLTTADMVIPIAVPISRAGAGVVGAVVLESV